ncbi:hypothetical protein, unlikely [Trypanosoma congolense IL3000]|uniref:Uncharacterized protein n=1 Tax=Trypanosoma congolense (strain IL3000) TaxID=1068625 RepID=F9WJ82_TRYCI|nr:hypothetical protein, unlikely [Trypanosoma congolense IL3000]
MRETIPTRSPPPLPAPTQREEPLQETHVPEVEVEKAPTERFSPWTMQPHVGAILLQGIQNPELLRLYEFLRLLCLVFKQDYSGLTVGDFLRDPERRIPDTLPWEEVMKKLHRLMTRLRIHILATLRYLAWRNIRTLEEWLE